MSLGRKKARKFGAPQTKSRHDKHVLDAEQKDRMKGISVSALQQFGFEDEDGA